jgi:hypothetical protein
LITLRRLYSESNNNVMKRSPVQDISWDIVPFFYHHNVVIQHIVADILYQTGSFQRKTYIMLDKYMHCVGANYGKHYIY